jgi:FtsH-binding integral membrane protein
MPDQLAAMQIAFGLSAVGAAGGLVINALQGLGAARINAPMGRVHGMVGLAGMALLFALNLRGEAATPAAAWQGLILLLFAVLGGLMLAQTSHGGRPPFWLALANGAVAAAGLWLLWPLVHV